MGFYNDTRKGNFFCPELAVFLGSFAPNSDVISSDTVDAKSVVDVNKFIEAITNALKFVSLSPMHDVDRSKLVLCRAVYSLIETDDNGESVKVEDFTTATYLRGIVPLITSSQFVQIICSCDFFKQAGVVFSHASVSEIETLFQAILLEKEVQYNADSICSFLWKRWMTVNNAEPEDRKMEREDLQLLIESFQDFTVAQLREVFQNLCVHEIETLENDLGQSEALIHERAVYFTNRVNQLKHVYEALNETLKDGPENCENRKIFYYLLNKACFLHGYKSLIEDDDLIVLKAEMKKTGHYSDIDFAQISINHGYADSVDQFCFLLRTVCAMSESNDHLNSLLDLISKNTSQFLDEQTLKEIVRLTLTPSLEAPLRNTSGSSFESRNVMQIRNMFFQHLSLMPKQSIDQLLCELYEHLYSLDETKYCEWSTTLACVCDSNEAKLTEVFNRLNRKELEDETSATFQFLLKSSFVNPDKIIEKAVNDAVASRGKTMLVEQLLERVSPLLTFSLRKDDQQPRVPYIISAFAAANVSNINSACQFLQFLVAKKNFDPEVIFTEALVPKMSQNKVNAVKLLVSIAPHVETEKCLYVATLEMFFTKQPQTSLDLDNEWVQKFRLLGFEEFRSLELKQQDDQILLSLRELLLRNEANKFNALTDFFDVCVKSLISKNYDLTKIVITEVPEFFTYHQNEVVVSAFKFLQKLSAVDSRSLALCLKILYRENLVKLKQTVSNVNIFTWKVLIDLVKLCLSCEKVSYPNNFIDGFMTILKGVLKWVHADSRSENDEFKRQYLLLSFCIDMLSDVLFCSCLTLEYQPQSQVVFRDAFYLLVDQVQNHARVYVVHKSNGHDGHKDLKPPDDNSIKNETDEMKRKIRKSYLKVVDAAKICNYSLPGSFEVLESDC